MLTRQLDTIWNIADIADIAVTAGCYLMGVGWRQDKFSIRFVSWKPVVVPVGMPRIGDIGDIVSPAAWLRRGFQAELSSKVQLLCYISLEAWWNGLDMRKIAKVYEIHVVTVWTVCDPGPGV